MVNDTGHPGSPLLAIGQLCCSQAGHPERPLLDSITFQIDRLEHTAIIGQTGAGKSTLLACILGDTNKLRGLKVNGIIDYRRHNLLAAKAGTKEIWMAGGICWIPQEPETALNPTRSVKAQLVEMICARLKHSPTTGEALLKTNFELADQLALFAALDRYPGQFSGGELQRILFIHALVGNPKLVLADEPTTALDKENKQLIMSLLMKLITATGATLVISSHDYDTIRQCCKRFIYLENGKLVEAGPMSQLGSQPLDSNLTLLLHDYDQLQSSLPKDISAIPE